MKKAIDEKFNRLFKINFPKILKEDFNIVTKNSLLTNRIESQELRKYVSDLANRNSKGKEIDRDNFLEVVTKLRLQKIPDYDEKKFKYLIYNYKDNKSTIYKILNIDEQNICKNKSIQKIEEHDEAIRILDKFDYKTDCIVCDNDIEYLELLERKRKNRNRIFEELDDETKKVLQEIIEYLGEEDLLKLKPPCLKQYK